MSEIKAEIWDDADELVVVTGEYTPESRGMRDGFGLEIEPSVDADIVILDAVGGNGTTRNLSSNEHSRAMDALWEVAEAP